LPNRVKTACGQWLPALDYLEKKSWPICLRVSVGVHFDDMTGREGAGAQEKEYNRCQILES
jgi:hypothetical protein